MLDHAQWFENIGRLHITDPAIIDIDSSVGFTLGVSFSQLDDGVYRVETSIFSQGSRNYLKRTGEGFDCHLLTSTDSFGIGAQFSAQCRKYTSATGKDRPIFPGDADDTDAIVECSTDFVDHVLGTTTKEDTDALGLGATGDEGHIRVADLALLDSCRMTQVFSRQVVEIGDHTASRGLG